MNCWQASRQIKFLLESAVWPDAPGGPVFASVKVTQGMGEDEGKAILRFPMAFVSLQDGESDPVSPALKMQRWQVTAMVTNAGDIYGEDAIIGSHRSSQGYSEGRGLLEVEELLLDTLNLADQTNGINIVLVGSSSPEAVLDENYGYVAERRYTFGSVLTTERTYQRPNGGNALIVTTTTPGGGTSPVQVSWTAPAPRFDLHQASAMPLLVSSGQLLLTRKSGTAPPSSPSDGTPLTLSGPFAALYLDSLPTGSGSWSYGLFAQFDEFGDGVTSLRLSSPAVCTVSV